MIFIIMTTTTTLMMMMNRITVEFNCFLVTEKRCYALLIILQQNKHGMSTQPVLTRTHTTSKLITKKP